MKLSAKYIRVNGVAIIIVVLFSSIGYYFFIRQAFNLQLNKDLHIEEMEILDFVHENHSLPETKNYNDQQEDFIPSGYQIVRSISDTTFFNANKHENISYRQLVFPLHINGIYYHAIVRKSRVETEDLIQMILTSTLVMVLTLLLSLILVNRFLLNKLWKPFQSTLQHLKNFNLTGRHSITLAATDIDEFRDLNNAVQIMINRVNQDYAEVKSFTENASHEIQTPLAIVKSKLELLSQSDSLGEENMGSIQTIFDATNRLSRLNQSLILLTKIDNQQFRENESVDLDAVFNKILFNYEELIEAKNITLKKNATGSSNHVMNETLAETMISNLITNAIKHNIDGGTIEIILNPETLTIINTGVHLETNPSELFERFKKGRVTSESLGLGLSIVKRICERYAYQVKYEYKKSLHSITIIFH